MTQVSRPSNMPNRPANVPTDARYASLEGWFEVGELKDGRRFGPYRAFRKDDGTLLFEARFDDQGRLQGTFKRYHRDGTIAREGAYNEGAAVGTWTYRRGKDDIFPASDPRATQAVCTCDRSSSSWVLFDVKGREVIAGEEIDENEGWANEMFANVTPETFLGSVAFEQLLEKEAKAATTAAIADDGFFAPFTAMTREPLTEAAYRNRYGEPLAPELVRFVGALRGRALDLGELETLSDVLPKAPNGRLFEEMVREHQESPGRALALREVCSCFVPLVRDHRGRLYGPCAVETRFGRPSNAVYRFDPQNEDFDLVARSVDDFAYLLGVWVGAKTDAVARQALGLVYEKLRARIVPIEPFASLHEHISPEDDGEVEGDEEKDHRRGFSFQRTFNAPVYLFYRSRWIRRLLRGNVEGAYASFRPDLDGGLNEQRFQNIRPMVPSEGMLGVYWLLRTFFLGDERIREMVGWCNDSPSAIVREVATLIADLLDGKRTALGNVSDVMAVRAAFVGMNPTAKKTKDDEEEDEEEEEDEDEAEEEDDNSDDDE